MFRTIVNATLFWLLFAVTFIAAPLTEPERQRLIAHLNMTEGWLVDEVAGLSRSSSRIVGLPEPGPSWRSSITFSS